MNSTIITPVVALVLWTLVMCAWLYATRLPAMAKLKVTYDPRRSVTEFQERLPPEVRWKADNYNHLMEQPTIFYALALSLALLGAGTGLNATLAWIYVGLRVVHSLVQATVNIVPLRFAIFMLATFVLAAMAIRAAMIVF